MPGQQDDTRWATRATTGVLVAALVGVAAVWVLSAWWSYAEQTTGASSLGFRHPAVLPWTLDGLQSALALTALAAALDGRPAVAARLGVVGALAGSIWSNRLGVQLRFADGREGLHEAVLVAVVAPLSAFVAFEVILGQIRRLVLRWRGLPAPAPVPALRPVRVLLAPVTAVAEWRRAVLDATAPVTATEIVGTPVNPRPGVPTHTAPATEPGYGAGGEADPETTEAPAALPAPMIVGGPGIPAESGAADPQPPVGLDKAGLDEAGEPSTRPASGVHPSSPPDGPDAGLDAGPDAAPDSPPDVHRTVRSPVQRPATGRRAGQSTGRRTGRTAGRSTLRPVPDEPDWTVISRVRGVSRSRAYELAKDPRVVAEARVADAAARDEAAGGQA